MPLVPTCLHAFQIAFGKAQSICFPTLHQHTQQSEQRLPTVGLCFVQNFLLAYQKFNANSTCFGRIQATKGGGSGRGEKKGLHSSPYMHFQRKKCPGREGFVCCGSLVAYQCLSTPGQTCCNTTILCSRNWTSSC